MKVPTLTLRLSRFRASADRRIVLRLCISSLAGIVSIPSRAAIKGLDRVLRIFLGIREFTQDPQCVLRFSRARSRSTIDFPGGESVREGDAILELHFWNDRLGTQFHRDRSRTALRSALRNSLALLAHQLRTDRDMEDIRAVHGVLARVSARSCSVHQPFGCPLYVERRCGSGGIHDFLEDLLVHLLHSAFNPQGHAARSFRLYRTDVWISACDLKERFGDPGVCAELPEEVSGTTATQSSSSSKMEVVETASD